MNGCIGTSLKSWKAWVKEPRQRRWSCGERSLTGSVRTKRWGWRCPAELYRDSSRPYHTAEVQLSYPGMARRLVDKNGKLSWNGQKVFLSGSLAGWEVGLQRTEKDQLEIWFGRLLLGHLDPQEVSFLRSEVALAS